MNTTNYSPPDIDPEGCSLQEGKCTGLVYQWRAPSGFKLNLCEGHADRLEIFEAGYAQEEGVWPSP